MLCSVSDMVDVLLKSKKKSKEKIEKTQKREKKKGKKNPWMYKHTMGFGEVGG